MRDIIYSNTHSSARSRPVARRSNAAPPPILRASWLPPPQAVAALHARPCELDAHADAEGTLVDWSQRPALPLMMRARATSDAPIHVLSGGSELGNARDTLMDLFAGMVDAERRFFGRATPRSARRRAIEVDAEGSRMSSRVRARRARFVRCVGAITVVCAVLGAVGVVRYSLSRGAELGTYAPASP